MSDIWLFISSLPWPSKAQVFTSICLGLISLCALALPRIIINAMAEHILPQDKVKRALIIKLHHRNDHSAKLKHCHAGYCKELTPTAATYSDQREAVVSAAVAAETTVLHPQ